MGLLGLPRDGPSKLLTSFRVLTGSQSASSDKALAYHSPSNLLSCSLLVISVGLL